MTELRPLLESSDDELERALLGAGSSELPSSGALRDVALALGVALPVASALATALPSAAATTTALPVGTVAPLAGVTSAAGAGAASGAAGTLGAASLGAASLGAVGKSLLVGAFVSFLALTTLDRTLGPAPHAVASAVPATHVLGAQPPSTAVKTSAAREPTLLPVNEPEQLSAAPAPEPSNRRPSARGLEPAPVTAAVPVELAPANGAFASEATVEPRARPLPISASLAAEISALDQTRAALAAGDTARAARLLDAYAATRPSPTLAQEAAQLRVQLLLKQGRRAAASALARQVIAQHPESAHVDSLRRLAAEP